MSCSLPEVKRQVTHEAMDVFQGNASSIRLNKSNNTAVIRWGPEFKIKTQQQAFQMVQTKFETVHKWAKDKFKVPYIGFGKIDGIDNNRIVVKFETPKALEKAYVVKLAQEGDLESAAKVAKDPYYYEVPNSIPKDPSEPKFFFQTDNEKQRVYTAIENVAMEFFSREGIEIKDMDEYAKLYFERTGEKLDAIALSNITDNVVAFATGKIDGTSMLEEAWHFLVYHLWDSGAFKAIRTGIDPVTRTSWLENSEEYLSNYSQYKDLYQNKLNQPDWKQMVEQEIVTKIITNYIYNSYAEGKYRTQNLFQRVIRNIIQWIKNKLGKKNPNGTDKFVYTKEVENELGDLGKRFMEGTLDTKRDKTATIPLTEFIDIQSDTATQFAKYATQELARLKAEKTRLIQLVRQTFDKNDKARAKELNSKYSIKDLDDLKLQIDILLNAQEEGTFTLADKELMDDLLDLEDLLLKDAYDKENAARIRELNNTIAVTQSLIEAKEYQRAVKFFLEGTAVYDSENDTYDVQNSIIEDASDMIKMLQDAATNYDPDARTKAYPNFIKALSFLNNFHPAIKDLATILTSKDRVDPLFTDLSKSEEESFKQNLTKAITTFANLEIQLDSFWKDIVKVEIADLVNRNSSGQIKFDDLNPEEMANDPQMDISGVTAWLGSMVDMTPWQIQGTIAKFAQVINRVNSNVRENAIDIIGITLENRKVLANNPIVQNLMKQYKLLRPEQLIAEMHKNNQTGYYLNAVNIGHWRTNQQAAANRILDDIEKFMDEHYSYVYKFPRGEDQHSARVRNKFLYEDTIRILKEEEVKNGKNPIIERYKGLWGKWFELNTKPRPDIAQYKLNKINELSTHDYEVWHEQNHYTYTDQQGVIHEYPAGELVIPNDKYMNNDFNALMAIPQFKAFYDKYEALKIASDDKLPIYMTSSYEFRYRMPQISVDAYDVFSTALRGVFKGLGSNLNEVFKRSILTKKADLYDDVAIRKLPTQVVPNMYTPPIRFTEKLDNPQNLSKDVLGALIVYNQMAENYSEMTKAIPMFEALRESVKRSDFRKPGDITKLADQPAKNTLSVIEKFFQTKVYGQGKQDVRISLPLVSYELSVTKLLELLAKFKRDINLRANYGSMYAGYIDATAKYWTEVIIGRNITSESQKFAFAEFYSNYAQILKDYESPIKTHKLTIVGQRINLMDPNKEMFHDTDKVRNINAFVRSTNYGTYRFLDYGIRNRTMLRVMHNYRFIDGKWYTRERWLGESSNNTIEKWEANENNHFYNKLELDAVKGKLKENSDITQAQWDFVGTRTKLLNRDIGGQKSDLDDAMFDHTLAGTWFLMHKSFLRLGVFKRLKRRHRNFVTEKWEEGTFRWAIDLATKKKTNRDIRLWQVLNLFSKNNELRPEQREGIIHTGVSIIWANIAFLMAVIIARSIDDDDDDPSMQFLQYLAIRNYQESTTFLAPQQYGQMVVRPVAGVDMLTNWQQLIPYLISDEDLSHSAYDTKRQRAWIKGFGVGYRGFYETFPIRTPLSPHSDIALKQKKNYMTGKLNNASPVVPSSWFMDFESE